MNSFSTKHISVKHQQVAKKDKEIFADAERLDVVNKAPIVLCELLFDDAMVAQVGPLTSLES